MAGVRRPRGRTGSTSAATVLALHAWGRRDPARFGWFEPPPPDGSSRRRRLLTMLGALGRDDGRITPLGRQLLGLPVHPRLARLLIAAAEAGRLRRGGRAGGLALREGHRRREPRRPGRTPGDPGPRPRGRPTSSSALDLLAEAEHARFSPRLRDRGIDPAAARQVARVRDD